MIESIEGRPDCLELFRKFHSMYGISEWTDVKSPRKFFLTMSKVNSKLTHVYTSTSANGKKGARSSFWSSFDNNLLFTPFFPFKKKNLLHRRLWLVLVCRLVLSFCLSFQVALSIRVCLVSWFDTGKFDHRLVVGGLQLPQANVKCCWEFFWFLRHRRVQTPPVITCRFPFSLP